ncbi:hypothetical protein [Wenyingzhuangia marina]|uniref:PH domain-containing protein n=1 Tax=Wenyingzhuangia marina TaxID=1195760 RepID=A0A1M5U259_9FLAO|nr:hypothetical protein [Wenyingzhuangia marina]GGF70098.1 hypothetical protein GCM10011397_11240 [Wenyingzhuangia marina]SHH56723.1 hypothetical protein SAMN05444281_0971 [Wenyingzhuangia marina]
MEKHYSLRKNPPFEIFIKKNEFKVVDSLNPEQSKTYYFNHIEKLSLRKEKINWISSFLLIPLSLLSQGGFGILDKNKNEIRFFHDDIPVRIFLKGCDMNIAESVFEILRSK